jgi:ABC-type molybdenum transport system ATPase subunit/photorepair protein PhrA
MNAFLVQIQNATVYLKDTAALKAVDWTVRPGENWALVGNNGSGKTTLLKLIFGELLPIDGGTVHWFNSRTWNGLAEIRERVGYVSAEYQENYDRNVTGLEVVESGFFASIGLWQKVTGPQKQRAQECLHLLEIEYWRGLWPTVRLYSSSTNPAPDSIFPPASGSWKPCRNWRGKRK